MPKAESLISERPIGVAVYVLSNPRSGVVHYVGVTKQVPLARLSGHLWAARQKKRKSRVQQWIWSLLKVGLVPTMQVIETVLRGADWAKAERDWIAVYRKKSGCALTNATDGGDGSPGFIPARNGVNSTSRPVTVGGLNFPSIRAAARHYGVHASTMQERIQRQVWDAPVGGGRGVRRGYAVTVDGQSFPSVRAAARHHGVHPSSMDERLQRHKTRDLPSGRGRGGLAHPVTINGQAFCSISAASRHYGLHVSSLHERVQKNPDRYYLPPTPIG